MTGSKEAKTIYLPGGTEGSSVGEFYKNLVIFEEALEVIRREVFGSPESKQSAADAVKDALGMNAEELGKLLAQNSSYRQAILGGCEGPKVATDPTVPSETKEKAWNVKKWKESYWREYNEISLPSDWDLNKTLVLIRGVRYLLSYMGDLDIQFPIPQIQVPGKGYGLDNLTFEVLKRMKNDDLRLLRNEISEWMRIVSNMIGSSIEHQTSGNLLHYVFEYLYTYLPAFHLAVDNVQRRFHFTREANVKGIREGPGVVALTYKIRPASVKVDFGKSWNPSVTERHQSLQNLDDLGWNQSIRDTLAEMGESMAHEHIEVYVLESMVNHIKSSMSKVRYSFDSYPSREPVMLSQEERDALFLIWFSSIVPNEEGPVHQITDAYCWEWGRRGFFHSLGKMESRNCGIVIDLDTVIKRYIEHPWTAIELSDINLPYIELWGGRKVFHRTYQEIYG